MGNFCPTYFLIEDSRDVTGKGREGPWPDSNLGMFQLHGQNHKPLRHQGTKLYGTILMVQLGNGPFCATILQQSKASFQTKNSPEFKQGKGTALVGMCCFGY